MGVDWQQVLVFVVVIGVFAAFTWGRFPVELIALGGAAVLLAAGVLRRENLLACFSNPAPVTIGALFVLSAALERTGVIADMGVWFNRLAKGSERRALLILLVGGALISALVNNTPLVVILLPVVLSFCRDSGAKPSRLLMPMSFATILGGTCSMAGTSTNLLIDGVSRELGLPAFSLFSIAPLGLLYAAVGGSYLWLFGSRLLPARDTLATLLDATKGREFLVQAEVPEQSKLIGRPALEAVKGRSGRLRILEVKRLGEVLEGMLDHVLLEEGDRLLIRTGSKGVAELRQQGEVKVGVAGRDLTPMEQREAVLIEGIIGPNSKLVGRSLREIAFRQRYGALILAVHREGQNITREFEDLQLQFGDTLLVEGSREGIDRLKEERDFIGLSEPSPETYHHGKRWPALAGIGLFVFLASFNFGWVGLPGVGFDTFSAAFIAALLVLFTGCLSPREAYEAVEWKILLLIIGMLGIGSALETSGAAAMLADSVGGWVAPYGPWVLLSALYLLSSVMTEMVSNNAVAVVITPLAVRLAEVVDASPVPFVVAVMFGASASFATPIGYQTNTYVFGAGGYLFRDFVRVGLPLNLILWLVATFTIPWLWPF